MTTIFSIHGAEIGADITYTPRSTGRYFTIGRKADIKITQEKRYASAIHAIIRIDKIGVEMRDANSTNGTYVNGKVLPLAGKGRSGYVWCTLQDGDIIHFGPSDLAEPCIVRFTTTDP